MSVRGLYVCTPEQCTVEEWNRNLEIIEQFWIGTNHFNVWDHRNRKKLRIRAWQKNDTISSISMLLHSKCRRFYILDEREKLFWPVCRIIDVQHNVKIKNARHTYYYTGLYDWTLLVIINDQFGQHSLENRTLTIVSMDQYLYLRQLSTRIR